MRWMLVWLCAMAALMTVDGALADQTVKTVDIPVGFGNSVPANTSVFKMQSINLPDRIGQMVYAVLELTGDYPANTNLTSMVNVSGVITNCTPVIMTPAVNVTNYHTEVDCSNAFVNFTGGVLGFGFRGTKAVSNIFGGLQLTYYNNPLGMAKVSGTEYSPGDSATIFVQLTDANNNPVQNGSCYVDIFYPGPMHMYNISNAPMVQASGGDGLYYYDLVVPSTLGVYMVSAKCAYTYNWQWIYPSDELVYSPVRGAVTGTWSGATQALNNPDDGAYEQCQTSTDCVANYTFNVSQYGVLTNVTNVNLYWLGEATKVGTLTFAYWNNSAWVNLPNTVATVATGSTTAPSGADQLQTNMIPVSAIIGGLVKVRLSDVVGSTHAFYDNWLSLAVLTTYGTIQNVKGSGEMHVTNIPSAAATSVWTYPARSLTTNLLGNTFYTITDTWFGINNTDTISGTNFTYYTGIFTDNFSVTSVIGNLTNQTIQFPAFETLPCNAILSLYSFNGSAYVNISYTTDWSSYQQCTVSWLQNLTYGIVYNFTILARNVWESEGRSVNTAALTLYPLLSAACNYWAVMANDTPYPYIVPMNETNVNMDNQYRACNNYLDDYYWFNQSYNSFLADKTKVVDRKTFEQVEADYYAMKFAADKLNEISYLETDAVMASGIYSKILLLNPLNASIPINQFWANISSPEIMVDALGTVNATVAADLVVDAQMNVTMNANAGNISVIKMQTTQINTTMNQTQSLVAQIWTWVQSIFNWTSATPSPGTVVTQGVAIMTADYYQQQASAVMAQVLFNGTSVTGAMCQVSVYYPNMTVQVSGGGMSYAEMDGIIIRGRR